MILTDPGIQRSGTLLQWFVVAVLPILEDIVNGHFAINVRWLLGCHYTSSLYSADESQQGRNSCPLLPTSFPGPFPWLETGRKKGPGNEALLYRFLFAIFLKETKLRKGDRAVGIKCSIFSNISSGTT